MYTILDKYLIYTDLLSKNNVVGNGTINFYGTKNNQSWLNLNNYYRSDNLTYKPGPVSKKGLSQVLRLNLQYKSIEFKPKE